MNSVKRCFISFAGADEDARALLGAELERHGIKCYDYSVPHESTSGMRLEDQLAEEIRKADVVVALVSNASTDPSKFVIRQEIRTAIDEGFLKRKRLIAVIIGAKTEGKSRAPRSYAAVSEQNLRIARRNYPDHLEWEVEHLSPGTDLESVELQLAGSDPEMPASVRGFSYRGTFFFSLEEWMRFLQSDSPILHHLRPAVSNRWFGAFGELQEFVWPHIEEVHPRAFHGIGGIVCEALELPYVWPSAEDSRLPFFKQLHRELSELPQYCRVAVIRQIQDFQKNVVRGAWRDVLINVRALRNLLRRHHADLYYPQLIEGISLLRLGEPSSALEVFQRAIQRAECEENGMSCMAKALFALGRVDEAMEAANEAIEICARRGEPAPIAKLDRFTLALDAKRRGFVSATFSEYYERALGEAIEELRQDFGHLPLEDRLKVQKLRAFAAIERADYASARKELEALIGGQHGRARFAPQVLAAFPNVSVEPFLETLAEAGVFLDEPAIGANGANLRIVGEVHNFWIIEGAHGFQFQRSADGSYLIGYSDQECAEQLFLLAPSNTPLRDHALERLEEAFGLFPSIELCRLIVNEWLERGNPRRASHVMEQGLDAFRGDPGLLQDLAEISGMTGDLQRQRQLLRQSRESAQNRLLSGICDHTPVAELLRNWARATALLGDESCIEPIATLLRITPAEVLE